MLLVNSCVFNFLAGVSSYQLLFEMKHKEHLSDLSCFQRKVPEEASSAKTAAILTGENELTGEFPKTTFIPRLRERSGFSRVCLFCFSSSLSHCSKILSFPSSSYALMRFAIVLKLRSVTFASSARPEPPDPCAAELSNHHHDHWMH